MGMGGWSTVCTCVGRYASPVVGIHATNKERLHMLRALEERGACLSGEMVLRLVSISGVDIESTLLVPVSPLYLCSTSFK